MATRHGLPRRLGVLLLTALLLLSTSAAALAESVAEGTPKRLFLAAKYGQWAEMTAEWREATAVTAAVDRRMLEEPATTAFSVTAAVEGSAIPAELHGLQEFLRDVRLVGSLQNDPVSGTASSAYRLDLKGEQLATLEMLQSADRLAVRIPEVEERYLAVENGGLQAAFQRLGVEWSGPDRILTQRDYKELMQVDPGELRAIGLDYGLFLTSFIRDEEVTLEADVPYSSPGGEQLLTRLTLSLSEERVRELLAGLAGKAGQDDRLLDLLAAKVAQYLTLVGASAGESPEMGEMERWQDQAYVKQQIQAALRSGEEAVRGMPMPGGLQISLLVDGENRVIQERIRAAVGLPDEVVRTEWVTDDWRERDGARQSKAQLSLLAGEAGQESGIVLHAQSDRTAQAAGPVRRTGAYELRLVEAGKEEPLGSLTLDCVAEREAEPGKERVSTDLVLTLADALGVPPVRGRVVRTGSSRADESRYEQDLAVKVTVGPDAAPLFHLTLQSELALDFAGPLAIPVLTPENSVILNNLSPAEMEALEGQLGAALERFVTERSLRLFPYFQAFSLD